MNVQRLMGFCIILMALLSHAADARGSGTLEGCRPPKETAKLLVTLGQHGWAEWDPKRIAESWPGYRESMPGQDIGVVVYPGRRIGSEYECSEAFEFSAPVSDVTAELRTILISYASKDLQDVKDAVRRMTQALNGSPRVSSSIEAILERAGPIESTQELVHLATSGKLAAVGMDLWIVRAGGVWRLSLKLSPWESKQ